MNGRLSQLNDLENKVFKEYIGIKDGEEPEKIRTPEGEFDNLDWIESEADFVAAEKERVELTTSLDGGTVGIEN